MTESFFEHCLRRLRAGDSKDELIRLLDEAESTLNDENYLTQTEAKETAE